MGDREEVKTSITVLWIFFSQYESDQLGWALGVNVLFKGVCEVFRILELLGQYFSEVGL